MFSENEKGEVVLTMSRDDWCLLLFLLGYARSAAHFKRDLTTADDFVALTNRLNDGNPRFRPYSLGKCPECGIEIIDPVRHDCIPKGRMDR